MIKALQVATAEGVSTHKVAVAAEIVQVIADASLGAAQVGHHAIGWVVTSQRACEVADVAHRNGCHSHVPGWCIGQVGNGCAPTALLGADCNIWTAMMHEDLPASCG